mmetsp:Transcript_9827/g.59801  ORF Transcript_9827/g.59801 Transcript_9827/m.59801 type:complete len:244 (+) Transcript_9827:2466-3197(+)
MRRLALGASALSPSGRRALVLGVERRFVVATLARARGSPRSNPRHHLRGGVHETCWRHVSASPRRRRACDATVAHAHVAFVVGAGVWSRRIGIERRRSDGVHTRMLPAHWQSTRKLELVARSVRGTQRRVPTRRDVPRRCDTSVRKDEDTSPSAAGRERSVVASVGRSHEAHGRTTARAEEKVAPRRTMDETKRRGRARAASLARYPHRPHRTPRTTDARGRPEPTLNPWKRCERTCHTRPHA